MRGMHIMRAWTTRPRENKAKIWTRCKCSQDMNSRREYGSYPCNTAHSARTTAILSCAAKWMQLEQYIRKLPAIETQRAKDCVFSLMWRKEKTSTLHSPIPNQRRTVIRRHWEEGWWERADNGWIWSICTACTCGNSTVKYISMYN